MIKVGIDWDDVVAPFNSIAIEMANAEFKPEPALSLEDITSWENTGRAECIHKYYTDEALYTEQSRRISGDVKNAVKELNEIADVYIITAVYPAFMGIRAKQIMDAFPWLPADRIILGAAKHLVQFDIVLDDNFCNVLNSPAQYPVLMRKPWNRQATGLLSINDMEEFVHLVRHILTFQTEKNFSITVPSVVAVVGPSGSGKNDVISWLCEMYPNHFHVPLSYTTNPRYQDSLRKAYVPEEKFREIQFVESTNYGGYGYGTKKQDIDSILKTGKCPVVALDICGAVGMAKCYPIAIIYVKRGKLELISSVIADSRLTDEEKTLRIISMDAEKKNASICHHVIENGKNGPEGAANEIAALFNL